MIMKKNYTKGITLVELLVVLALFSLLIIGISTFQRNIYVFNRFANDSLVTIQDGRIIIRVMVREMRSMSQANNGAYSIAQAATNTFTFFSDTNSDGLKEQIRYFINGTTLRKGSITPSGSPLSYNPNNEVFLTIASNVKNSTSTPLFDYHDSNYAGTSTPLALPANITDIHLVKINLLLDVDPNRAPTPRLYTSQVSLRNLKDNL